MKFIVADFSAIEARAPCFHSLIKREWLNNRKIENWEHAYQLIFEYIERFYNTVRIHSHCNYLSTNEYEQKYYWNN